MLACMHAAALAAAAAVGLHLCTKCWVSLVVVSISGVVVEYIVAIDVTLARFPDDAFPAVGVAGGRSGAGGLSSWQHFRHARPLTLIGKCLALW